MGARGINLEMVSWVYIWSWILGYTVIVQVKEDFWLIQLDWININDGLRATGLVLVNWGERVWLLMGIGLYGLTS